MQTRITMHAGLDHVSIAMRCQGSWRSSLNPLTSPTSVDDFADIWIDLGASDDASVVVLDTDERDAHDLIRVVDLLNSLEHMRFLEDQIGKLDANIVAKIKEAGLEREWEQVQSAPGL